MWKRALAHHQKFIINNHIIKRFYTTNNMSSSSLKLGMCQLQVSTDKSHNVQNAIQSIQQAVNSGAQLVVLPGMYCVIVILIVLIVCL
jgi:hypothetical protein